jgi:hypothetical protein
VLIIDEELSFFVVYQPHLQEKKRVLKYSSAAKIISTAQSTCVTISKLGQKVTLQGIEPGSLL